MVELLKDASHNWFNCSLSPSLAANVPGIVLASGRLLVPGFETSTSGTRERVSNSVLDAINMNSMNDIMVTGCMKGLSSH